MYEQHPNPITEEQQPESVPFTATEPEDWEYPVKAGRHPAKIIGAEVRKHADGYPLTCIRLEILDAALAGHVESKWYHLKTKKAVTFLKKDFARIGFDVNSQLDLAEACGAMVGLEIEITVDYTNGSQVIYFTKRSEPGKVLGGVNVEALWQD